MYKAVIFDSGGVLIQSKPAEMLTFCAKRLGVKYDDFLHEYLKQEKKFQKGQISETTFWKKIFSSLQIDKPIPNGLWAESFCHAYRPVPESIELVKRVKKAGYRTGLLSNTEKLIVPHLNKMYAGLFDVRVLSCNIGLVKPEPRIYKLTLKLLEADPEKTVFIDDNLSFVESARKIGLKAIQFHDPISLENLLDKLLVNFKK